MPTAAPLGGAGLLVWWLSSACASGLAGRGAGAGMGVGVPQPSASASDTVSRPAPAPPGAPSAAAAMPLLGRAIKCENGHIKAFPCRNVELLAYLPSDSMGTAGGFDLWGWTDSATGREFVILGGTTGTAFVEVTDPVHPRYLGVLRPRRGAKDHGIPSVKVYQHYAFVGVVSIGAGIQVFDLTQLRAVTSPQEFQETAHYDSLGNTHTIAVNPETGFLYANGSNTCGGGLHMIDVRTPTQPTFAGCYTDPKEGGDMGVGWTHDSQCVRYRGPDRRYRGREVCLSAMGSAVVLVDVTDKRQPRAISAARYPNVGYAHQGWLTEDQRYFFLGDEFDESNAKERGDSVRTRTIVFDLRQLDDPVVLTEFWGTTDATDHNLYLRGRYMYQANYAAGLRIIDVADPKHPKEVGYLDTAPSMSGPGMQLGAWGSYPFFKHGVVAVASEGLFLVRLRQQRER